MARSRHARSQPEVHVMLRAASKIRRDLEAQFERELKSLFPTARAITVYECFHGYSNKQGEKVVLGVEVRSPKSHGAHIVKLGSRGELAPDYDGWRRCFKGKPFSSRIFVSVEKKPLPRNRVAIIYHDAFQLYGDGVDAQPHNLETVVRWAIHDDKPNPESVERVIRQIYADMARWFYLGPRIDAEKALDYYLCRLRRAMKPWREDAWRVELRRDLIWLFCGQDAPDSHDGCYLDAYDFVQWVMARRGRVPETLVGNSHGDLHGRNILVGIQRGEAEYPSVFDYGEMRDNNVLVWDYVKLETELKVRLLLGLHADKESRQTLFSLADRNEQWQSLANGGDPSAEKDERAIRAEQLAFAFEFEKLLARLTSRIGCTSEAGSPDPPGGRKITGNRKLDRAIAILLRVRQEAALWLGEHQPQRSSRNAWRDEYYFALAIYGLSTAKWDYKCSETGFALVSAGVAVSQVSTASVTVRQQIEAKQPPKPPYPCYRVPLAHARRLWKKKRTTRALGLLKKAETWFHHAVPLLQEYALMLAGTNQDKNALDLLKPLQDLCGVFRDFETLSRIGRTYKDLGDEALKARHVEFSELSGHPAAQFYRTACIRYKEAVELAKPDQRFYPGVNAATMAFLAGEEDAGRLAQDVLDNCRHLDFGAISGDDHFWILVSEGEASLLVKNAKVAADFYAGALSRLNDDQSAGMVQSAYDQLSRLWWALGEEVVGKVVRVFEQHPTWPELDPGPLGDRGYE